MFYFFLATQFPINKSPKKTMTTLQPNTKKPGAVDTDVNITAENQKKINQFAIRNGWIEELNEELKVKKNLLKNLEDAEGDVLLMDEGEMVPILMGESFVLFEGEEAGAHITSLKLKTTTSITQITQKISTIKCEMSSLKSFLYTQFGDSINLECEEED